jgi:hypothetical protein
MRLYHERHLKSDVTSDYFISKVYCELYLLRLFTLTVQVVVINILVKIISICSCFNLLHRILINVGALNLYNFYVMFSFMVLILFTIQNTQKTPSGVMGTL